MNDPNQIALPATIVIARHFSLRCLCLYIFISYFISSTSIFIFRLPKLNMPKENSYRIFRYRYNGEKTGEREKRTKQYGEEKIARFGSFSRFSSHLTTISWAPKISYANRDGKRIRGKKCTSKKQQVCSERTNRTIAVRKTNRRQRSERARE